MKNIAIIGAGSAGILSTCHMISYLPTQWKVTLIHEPTIPTLGIGESTNPSFCSMIEKGLDFIILDEVNKLDGTFKFGTKFKKWREKDFLNHLIGGSFAIHFDTNKLKDFAIERLKTVWGDKFSELQGRVDSLENKGEYAEVKLNNQTHVFDYVIDCRGFPKDYSNYTMSNLPLNRCLVHNVMEPGTWQYTGHRATRNGWMFEIPLTTRQSYGYLFSDKITSVSDAKEDFSKEIGVPVDQLNDIEYRFTPYYANEIFDGRICKNGNAALFFEPMSANSLWAYYNINSVLLHHIVGHVSADHVNEVFLNNASAVEEIIAFFYAGGSEYSTPFWNESQQIAKEKLKTSKHLVNTMDQFSIQKAQNIPVAAMNHNWVFDAYVLKRIENFLGYRYFS